MKPSMFIKIDGHDGESEDDDHLVFQLLISQQVQKLRLYFEGGMLP